MPDRDLRFVVWHHARLDSTSTRPHRPELNVGGEAYGKKGYAVSLRNEKSSRHLRVFGVRRWREVALSVPNTCHQAGLAGLARFT
ncbi:hypothetical protein AKJ09_06340 [Labilithrix luteola]|uniref:Uncharacterized protein n=1 Tax=Labilithrix luteola TaxID=1391654 RepID=A0A0K1Q1Z5_9BACT|nr:hypothetical protein AKJ09_06340 [Labilithrix luteola]